MALTPDQCREARQLLGWTRERLARASRFPLATLQKFETGGRALKQTVEDIQRTLEIAGVEFIAESGGTSVRLRKPQSPISIAAGDLNASNDE
jgi:transcriptional regulator with XRE-family HTH domain